MSNGIDTESPAPQAPGRTSDAPTVGTRPLRDLGSLDVGRHRFGPSPGTLTRRTGLYLPVDLTIEAWQRIGRQIFVISDSSAWWWGDWLIFGEERYPDRYRRAINETGLDYQTLRNYAWVARRFPMSRRRDKVSFQHHVVVAALPEDERDRLLSEAEKHRWSRNELRRRLRETRSAALSRPDSDLVYQLKVDHGRRDRWQRAAVRANVTLADWMVVALDQAADELLEAGEHFLLDQRPPLLDVMSHGDGSVNQQ
jgi:hypothetical protein